MKISPQLMQEECFLKELETRLEDKQKYREGIYIHLVSERH